MSERFFSEIPLTAGQASTLSGAEARHAQQVMRLVVGDRVTLFDGSGDEFVAQICGAKRGELALQVLERRAIDREAARRLTLGVALPKGERQRWLVEKAVELGVARLAPLDVERGVAEATSAAVERMRRGVVEASKQCGRNRLMEIAAPQSLADFLAAAPTEGARLLAHPGDTAEHPRAGRATEVWAACGPEGGFTEAEVARALAAGWTRISLGPRILRVETAALALAALAIAGHWQLSDG